MKRNYTLLHKDTKTKAVLSFDDRKKIVSFVQLLMAINNRVSANSTSQKKRKSEITKRKDDKIALKLDGKSSLKRRALLFSATKSNQPYYPPTLIQAIKLGKLRRTSNRTNIALA